MNEKTVSPANVQPVNWEAVRMLALAVGVREAARKLGINEETVKKRCTREGWLSNPDARAASNAMAVEKREEGRAAYVASRLSPTLSPSAVFAAELADLGSKSRLALAKAVQKGSAHAAELSGPEILEQSQNVKSIAQTADLVHGWKDAAPQVKLRLDILGSAASAETPIEIEADVTEIPSVSDSESWDNELDSY